MDDFQDITKHQFDDAYNKHLPSKWIKFAFKYFSKETEDKNMSIQNNLEFYLIGIFILGLFGTILKLPHIIIGIFTMIFSIILIGLILFLTSAVLLNNFRIKKIRKSLGITRAEYKYLADKFN